MKQILTLIIVVLSITSCSCKKNNTDYGSEKRTYYNTEQFVMGADLSYLNQILDFGGVFSDSAEVENPYTIFREYGTNVVRLRLWHNPEWTREIYGDDGTQLYNDFEDVKRSIEASKINKMKVLLDFHYSDNWADPAKQRLPAAWEGLSFEVLVDSIYNYTYITLSKLAAEGLMPEYVQIGNEINPGILLPLGDRWNNNTANFVTLMNSAIKAVRDAGNTSVGEPEIIIHVAQPENILNWFQGLSGLGLTDYDIVGLSYYYIWSDVELEDLSDKIAEIRSVLNRDVMIMETCYPFTTANADSYGNIIDTRKLSVSDYPPTIDGQYNYLVKLTQEIIDGGGSGIFYWEPAWITSDIKTQWGQGSAWDCNTLFDFDGSVIRGMDYMTNNYDFD